jgi:RNA polymerase sigma-70 factor (ECF subfamily)
VEQRTEREDQNVTAGSDNELMMRVHDGHTYELGILFERHHERLLTHLMRMTGNRAASEDLVQEVFVRMLRFRESFRGDRGGFSGWMYTLAHNVCMDYFRRGARRDHQALPDQEPPGDEPGPHDQAEKGQTIAILRRALLMLPEDKREVLLLRRFGFKKYDEIAEILECPVGTVKVRAHRAIRELREIYDSLMSEAPL